MHYRPPPLVRSLFTLALSIFLFGTLVPSAAAQEIWWTGGSEDNNNWSNADNWNLARIPNATDIVRLGYADEGNVANTAQTINFDATGEFEISKLWFDNEGSRSVTLTDSRADTANYIRMLSTADDAVSLNSTATADASVGLTISARRILNLGSGDAEFIFGLNTVWLDPGNNRLTFSRGTARPTVRIQDINNFQWRPSFAVDVIIDIDPSASQTFSNEIINNNTLHYYFATDGAAGSFWPSTAGVVQLNRLGSEDRKFRVGSYSGVRDGTVEIIAGEPGQGHFTFQVSSFGENGSLITTAADSTVEIFTSASSASRVMRPASNDNPGVTGPGNLRLKMTNSGEIFSIARDMTYTGRTILESGVMRMGWVDGGVTHNGSLPEATIVEVSAAATLRLFNTTQTIGGLTGYTDHLDVTTYGTVNLEGGSLRINSATATSFAGTFTGTGALIKSGAETFTISGDYSNVADRLLRVEAGILEVTGALDVSLGTFELAGGRILANSLLAQEIAWAVMLSGSTVDQRLVDALTTVNITDSTLALSLEQEFIPLIGSQYTLVYAGNNITGASAGNMFGYADGDTITVDGVDFTINWVLGSESIVLTVIPEPRLAALSFAILALMASILVKRRRNA